MPYTIKLRSRSSATAHGERSPSLRLRPLGLPSTVLTFTILTFTVFTFTVFTFPPIVAIAMNSLTTYPTFVDLMGDRVQCAPDRIAFTFLKDGETKETTVSYGELERQAVAIASRLQEEGGMLGDRALLVYPYDAGLEFIAVFLGCLYAGIVAIPTHPPRNRPGTLDVAGRLVSSEARFVLTPASIQTKLQKQLDQTNAEFTLPDSRWIATDKVIASTSLNTTNWHRPELQNNTLAFLQYTSGSTGLPKGVMVDHEGLMHNQQLLSLAFGHSEDLVGVGWLPLFHDMGLIGNVLQSLYWGTPCVLMSPMSFIQKPVRWLQAISRYRASTSGGPNFAYDLLCRHVSEAQLEPLDLSSWQVAFSGAEPVQPQTLEQFAAKFAPCGFRPEAFYPCYGMAEATLFITGGQASEPPRIGYVDEAALAENRVAWSNAPSIGTSPHLQSVVSCGHAWLDRQIAIVNPQTLEVCNPEQVGEIWVAGSGLGKGYWHRPEATEQTFQAYQSDTKEGPFLRTGDLGFVHEGELFITGRLNDVLVFWGLNHYPAHIEHTVERCHPGFRANSGAAFAIPVEGRNRLVVAQEVERTYRKTLKAADVAESIRWQLFDQHFVDVYGIILLKPGGLPKTSSGKVQRGACRDRYLSGELAILDEWRSPTIADIPTLIRRYMNPLTHVKRLWTRYRARR